jgi:hypothetical protein
MRARGIGLAKARGTYLVMDIYNDDCIMAEYKRLAYPQKILDKEAKVGRTQRENFRKAAPAGVKLAFGTGAGVYPHGWNGKAVREDGGVRPNAYAGDPDRDRQRRRPPRLVKSGGLGTGGSVLEHVSFVMKGGVVYKQQ